MARGRKKKKKLLHQYVSKYIYLKDNTSIKKHCYNKSMTYHLL